MTTRTHGQTASGWAVVVLAPIALLTAPVLLAQTETHPVASEFDEHVRPLLAAYCSACHNDQLATAALSFDSVLDGRVNAAGPDVWTQVAERLRSGEMPPAGRPAPREEDVVAVTRWVDARVGRTSTSRQPDPGHVTTRRLNRVEYNNTVRSLLGIYSRPANEFPVDDSGYGFDNNGDVLSLSPLLMEKYVEAARRLSHEAVFGTALPGEPIQLAHYMARRSHDATGSLDDADTLPYSMRGALYGTHLFPWTAEYELRFRVANYRRRPPRPQRQRPGPPDTPAELDRFMEEMRRAAPPVSVIATLDSDVFNETIIEGVNAFGYERGEVITRLRVEAGEHTFRVSYPHVANLVDPRENVLPDGRRILYIDYLDIVGPFTPSSEPPDSYDKVFICRHRPGEHQESCAGEIATSLARRAYRRPPTTNEIDRLTALVTSVQQEGDSLEEGIRVAIQAVLLSPHFLFRIERDPTTSSVESHTINDHELATRLSYFLWADMPDDELFRLADDGQISRPDILDTQVRRMLADPRSTALVDTFAAQWLQLRNLDRVKPDPDRFPTVDDELRDAMRRETELFLEAIIHEDRSVFDLLDAPFTFLNGPLAHHYGIGGVTGEAFQRVTLTGDQRGGLLGHASILTVSSYPTRTSPVIRGKWVLENLLDAPPPDPPDDVPALDEAAVGIVGSLRDQLEQHRANPTCAVCHDQIDPLGFGLERYDAAGAWRTHDGTFEIDDSGTLPDGTTFRGPAELRAVLKTRQDAFTRNLVKKLLTYAVGRGLEPYDATAVSTIQQSLVASDHRFSSLVRAIVHSDPFRMRRLANPGSPPRRTESRR
ncbi:MAG: DUF1592 domain-containing protein [Acidobacteriota bacterium]|nr:DUF1592 domain-containing protein [Acidobacteriota bacterium]